ncbi:hypothetical protein [uncultured Erythrobacter sp.]|uniref:hypothetical protein n=1 Tax=uncultured Erythrobacter sp. TaxID=263913 RepID=UPI002628B22E|nr:hypothetical protein [uncultured Erythrobacter sp.]
MLVPPGQFFSRKLTVGVAAAANNGGTLIGGIANVRFHFEGNTVDVADATPFTFKDANRNEVTYWGYWATLTKPANLTGEAHLFVEVVPADPTMQARIIGPYSFFPSASLHDAQYTVDTTQPATGSNFHSFDSALLQIKIESPANPRLLIKVPLENEPMNGLGSSYTPTGYLTVEATAPVTFGRSSINSTATVDSDSNLRPKASGIWLKGGNITIDYANVDHLFAESGKSYVLDGINMTNSRGAGALWRGGPYFTGFRVRNDPYLLEVSASNLENIAVAANLVRGGTFSMMSRDIFADARCLVGTQVATQNDSPFNNDAPAFDVQYSGSESSATLARSGAVDPNDATYTFAWGSNSATFSVGKQATDYAGTGSDGYLFSDVVDFINTTLAGQDPGWSATLNDSDGRRASSGTLIGRKGQGFPATDCKGSALEVLSNFDAHGDWYQQRFNLQSENVIAYDNLAFDMQTQNIFLSSNVDARDFVFFNNALGNDPVGSDYFSDTVVFSQIGRSNQSTAISHVVVAHCSMPNQGFSFRNDGTPSTFDSYCLIANNVFARLVENGSAPIEALVTDNHIHAGETPMDDALATTTGGDRDSLFADFNAGDFAPVGTLLANPKTPVFERDLAATVRDAPGPVGALYPSIPE